MPPDELQPRAPHFIVRAAQALTIGGTLKAGHSLVPLEALQSYGLVASVEPVSAERVFFAFEIPYLPILSASTDLLGDNNKERLAEILEQHTTFLSSLAKWVGAAFALRYVFSPHTGEISITLLGRVTAKPGHGRVIAETIASDVMQQLQSLFFPALPVVSEQELQARLVPGDRLAMVEIWQHQHVARLYVERSFGLEERPAVVICPFRRPMQATWIAPFELITAQDVPVVINIHVEPTGLFWFEQDRLEERIRDAQSAATYRLKRNTYEREVNDPVAAMVGRLYADTWQRLSTGTPLVMTMQVASPDPRVAYSVAQSLAKELTEVRAFDLATNDQSSLPTGFDIVVPQNKDDQMAAWRTLTEMDIHPLEASHVEYIGRLQYLIDTGTASAAFRFPIPLKNGMPGIRTQFVRRGWNRGPKKQAVPPGEIGVGEYTHHGGVVSVPLAAFKRHTLIAGNTGSGKTTTCFHLLAELWSQNVPFLVIEPVGREYRNLLTSPIGGDLRVYTLGDERTSRFRFNPLEVVPGVAIEVHIGRIRACLEASVPTFGPLPALFEEALHAVYPRKGWELDDRPSADDDRQMPTLGEFYLEIVRIIDKRGWTGEVLQNIRAATTTRLGSLLRGSKGRMLNTRRSFPIGDLLAWPTVLEMHQLNDEEKSLLILFVLTSIGEYLESTYQSSSLRHITLIEEAHKVMSATEQPRDRELSSATRAEATGLISTNLSEVRKWGQGFILAEQYASRLSVDALANTNIKIVHDLRERTDRVAVAATMRFSSGEEDKLIGLPPGQAALYSDSSQGPSFIAVSNYRAIHNVPEMTPDEDVRKRMAGVHDGGGIFLPFDGCTHCQAQCVYRDRVGSIAYQLESIRRFRIGWDAFQAAMKKGDRRGAWEQLIGACREILEAIGLSLDAHAAYCLFSHQFTERTSQSVAQAFMQYASEVDHGR